MFSKDGCEDVCRGPRSAIAVWSLSRQGWMITYLGLPWKLTARMRAGWSAITRYQG
jgi:hypothetical protein